MPDEDTNGFGDETPTAPDRSSIDSAFLRSTGQALEDQGRALKALAGHHDELGAALLEDLWEQIYGGCRDLGDFVHDLARHARVKLAEIRRKNRP